MTTDETTAARVAAPMSDPRLAELRAFADELHTGRLALAITPSESAHTIHECLNEIERLRLTVKRLEDLYVDVVDRHAAAGVELERLRAVVAERDAEIGRLRKAMGVVYCAGIHTPGNRAAALVEPPWKALNHDNGVLE